MTPRNFWSRAEGVGQRFVGQRALIIRGSANLLKVGSRTPGSKRSKKSSGTERTPINMGVAMINHHSSLDGHSLARMRGLFMNRALSHRPGETACQAMEGQQFSMWPRPWASSGIPHGGKAPNIWHRRVQTGEFLHRHRLTQALSLHIENC